MKKYLIFDLDGTLISSDDQIDSIIYDYVVNNIDSQLLDTARYLIENNQWMSIKETFNILVKDPINSEMHYRQITAILDKIQGQVEFYPWVLSKIKELSNQYTLFLSTWNSDKFANDVLKRGWISQYFDKILWSTYILKSTEHIKELINYTWDEDFCLQAVFIWDGQRDREIAKAKNIDFIHIWTNQIDSYEIKNVSNIDSILKKLDN